MINYRTIVPDKKDKGGKKKIIIEFENKAVQVPTEDEEEIEEIVITKSLQELPSAGQPGWEYSEVVCSEELLVSRIQPHYEYHVLNFKISSNFSLYSLKYYVGILTNL